MQSSLWLLLLILLGLVLISAFFSGSEIGLMSLNRYKLRYLAKSNNKTAIRVSGLLQRPDKLLSVIIIGNTLANIIASMVGTLVGQRLYGNTGVAIATLLLTLIILVAAEMVPKTLAALYPQQVAFAVSRPLLFLLKFFAPLVHIISWVTNTLLKLFGISLTSNQREHLSGEELRSVLNEAGSILPVEHKSMLLSLLDLETATVEDIMIPCSDIVGLDITSTWQEICDQLETAQHTRLPLYKESIDNLIGIVHVRDVLNLSLEGTLDKENLLKIVEKPYYTPEETLLSIQITNFQKQKKRSCFVVDEYGDIQGLITLEDILEEIIGDFTTDIADFSTDIAQQKDGSVIVDASITLRHLARILGWKLPALGPRTLSGLIIEHLGYIPPADCCLVIDTYQIEILKVGVNMISNVRMKKII